MAKVITIQKGASGLTVTVQGFTALYLPYAKLTADIRHAAMVHGLAQKLGDAGAKSRDGKTGKSATPAEKYASIKGVYDALCSGMWAQAAGGVSNSAITPERVTVLARMFGKPEEAIQVWLKTRTEEQLASAFTNPKFALALAEYRAETRSGDDEAFDGLDEEIETNE